MLVVGSIPSGGKNPLEIIFQGEGPKEAFHVLVDPGDKKNHIEYLLFPPEQEFIQRWAVPENITSGLIGEPGEGTTIDLDEPFLLR